MVGLRERSIITHFHPVSQANMESCETGQVKMIKVPRREQHFYNMDLNKYVLKQVSTRQMLKHQGTSLKKQLS